MNANLPVTYLVDSSVAVTGAFISACDEARSLAAVTRTVLVLPRGHTIPDAKLNDFWRVETIAIVSLSKRTRAMLRYFPALIAGTWRLRKLMKQDGATRLQLNDFFLLQGVLLRVLGYHGHITTWVRCEPVRFAGPLARPILWLVYHSSNRMVAVSHFIQSLLPKRYAAEVVYNFYDGPIRTPRTWGATDEKAFLCIGNYIAGKGQDIALEAFAQAAAQDATITLHFYGGDMGLQKNRDYRQRLEARAQQLGIAPRVTFHHFVADTYPMLQNAYAALNCSVSESFSRTVLEASGAGVPVIATASGGPQEILVEGITGYLVPVGDVESAAKRILSLAQDARQAAVMGQAGAQYIASHFSAHLSHDKLIAVLGLEAA